MIGEWLGCVLSRSEAQSVRTLRIWKWSVCTPAGARGSGI